MPITISLSNVLVLDSRIMVIFLLAKIFSKGHLDKTDNILPAVKFFLVLVCLVLVQLGWLACVLFYYINFFVIHADELEQEIRVAFSFFTLKNRCRPTVSDVRKFKALVGLCG